MMQSAIQTLFRNRGRPLVFAGIFCLVGAITLLLVHAAPQPGILTLASSGAVKGNATVITDASAGKVVRFGSGSTTSGGGGSTTSAGIITAGNSKANCITIPGGTYGEVSQTNLTAAEKATGLTYNCLETFANPSPTWNDWIAPWQFTNDPNPSDSVSWEHWLATGHQMILGVDLIPQSAGSTSNPLAWEQACAAGDYNTYATQLAKNLVSYGAGSIVIRLGIEANGSWEADYVGTTATEMTNWAHCYDNEVKAMRSVSGTKFLFVWNPNICTMDLPLSSWYPGNAYVDIIGADAYDADCHYSTLTTVSQEGWQAYYTDSASYPGAGFPSLSNIVAFAKSNNKPMSFPEWGLNQGGPDDATYVTNMGQLFQNNSFSFEAYFDTGGDGIQALGPGIPNATAAYTKEFK